MDISNLTPAQKKAMIDNAPFPYNRPDILVKYRGQNLVVVDDQLLGTLGEIDYQAARKHYLEQGKEPVIICLPPY